MLELTNHFLFVIVICFLEIRTVLNPFRDSFLSISGFIQVSILVTDRAILDILVSVLDGSRRFGTVAFSRMTFVAG